MSTEPQPNDASHVVVNNNRLLECGSCGTTQSPHAGKPWDTPAEDALIVAKFLYRHADCPRMRYLPTWPLTPDAKPAAQADRRTK